MYRECGSTLYVGLAGIVRMLIQMFMAISLKNFKHFFLFFFRMSKASDNIRAAMKKQNGKSAPFSLT